MGGLNRPERFMAGGHRKGHARISVGMVCHGSNPSDGFATAYPVAVRGARVAKGIRQDEAACGVFVLADMPRRRSGRRRLRGGMCRDLTYGSGASGGVNRRGFDLRHYPSFLGWDATGGGTPPLPRSVLEVRIFQDSSCKTHLAFRAFGAEAIEKIISLAILPPLAAAAVAAINHV